MIKYPFVAGVTSWGELLGEQHVSHTFYACQLFELVSSLILIVLFSFYIDSGNVQEY